MTDTDKPTSLEQLIVLGIGMAAIGLGLYGGLGLAAAGPAVLPFGTAAALAALVHFWRPDGSWGATVTWRVLWVCVGLLALAGVVDVMLPEV